ncbi:monomeric [FeFe] hydrogenase [Prolixibacter denitrificans]|uniref:Hydrogenase n=1 Tax=Prolixibacter denitrificans TaxID=1541063 RepID=A0A2P8C9I3_9BACT|nr:monomeric [FeFe] hydrogenase [Prolixibacter denitrificans]PSK81623.1 [FeFe] hydrogenase (group B1/B3) [Prolixibacter denitrificans]GET21149.1 hydrogenase [Prolixibacter denitrificans]
MAYVNNTMIVRRELLSRLAGLIKEDQLENQIDRIPVEMSPRERGAQRRCCIYKERAVLKYKLMPILGLLPEEETDELMPLADYANEARQRTAPRKEILTVVDEACTACVKVNYVVSNLCRGCVASPCKMNCPKNAITFNCNGQAQIDPKKCVNCGICKNACPYHSIVHVPVPCEEACPVGAISKDEQGVEHIDDAKCIYCGKCLNACPFGSIFEISHIIDIFKAIQAGEQVIALPAPSILGQYNYEAGKVFAAIKELGFYDVMEVAQGAMITTTNEAAELKEKLESGQSFMTTSCCPGYVQAVEKHVSNMKSYVSHTKTPMYYAAELARKKYPDAKLVFIGPCIAKRKEAMIDPNVDYVMTFEELDSFFKGFEIDIENCEPVKLTYSTPESRGFAQSGGVVEAVKAEGLAVDVRAIEVNGINKKSIGLLKAYSRGKAPGNFMEVMACEGGCIAGPSAHVDTGQGKKQLKATLESLQA